MAWSFNIMIFCWAIELKLSEPTLAQNRLVSRPIYIKCSNSARFFSSRPRVESKNESISSGSRASSFSCSPIVMESTGMMKMATGDDSPLWQGAGTKSPLVFGGYIGLQQRNSRSRFLSRSLGIYRRVWCRSHVRGPQEESTRHRGAP